MLRSDVETEPGIFVNQIEEITVNGDIRSEKAGWGNMQANDTISLKHILSIITPEDSVIDFTEAVYVVWQGRKWSVVTIDYRRPRVELGMGALYNG